jgi:hypothetical protein
MALLEKQLGVGSFLPACFGMFGVVTSWRLAPMVVLASITVLIGLRAAGIPTDAESVGQMLQDLVRGNLEIPQRIEPIPDFLASAALLGYLGAFYRLRATQKQLFPRDRRAAASAGRGPKQRAHDKRSPELVNGTEAVLFLAVLPIWCGLAAVGLLFVLRMSYRLIPFPEPLRAVLFLIWLAAVVLGLLAAVLGYKSISEAEPEENLQFLQDQLWLETRHEQGRIGRWFTWARLRAQRRKTVRKK